MNRKIIFPLEIFEEIIFSFEISIEETIATDNLFKFRCLSKFRKKKIMDWLILAIKFNSINIINYILKNAKKEFIKKEYNKYPLIYYSGNREIQNLFKYTNDNYKIFNKIGYNRQTGDYINMSKEIIDNIIEYELIGLIKKIEKEYYLSDELIETIIQNHKHIIMYNLDFLKEKNYFDTTIAELLFNNKDLYGLNLFKNKNNLLDTFLYFINNDHSQYFSNTDLQSKIIVYEIHDNNNFPIKKEMEIEKYYIRILEILIDINNKNIIYFDNLIYLYELSETIFKKLLEIINIDRDRFINILKKIYIKLDNIMNNICNDKTLVGLNKEKYIYINGKIYLSIKYSEYFSKDFIFVIKNKDKYDITKSREMIFFNKIKLIIEKL